MKRQKAMKFYKYQGAGNDFVMIDNRKKKFDEKDHLLIESLCDRRFGIGGDGLILIQNHADYDFEMIYFNADGYQSSMCGNGGRCVVAFAKNLGIIDTKTRFLAIDGEHEAIIESEDWVELKMSNVETVEVNDQHFVLDTGSPHYVTFVEDLDAVDVFKEGRAIRYNERFKEKGINVNFVAKTAEGITVATYERGVEAETLACGTGVTACAIAHWIQNKTLTNIPIKVKGGNLSVNFEATENNQFTNIWLCGGATFVFEGDI
jgi:diaminopimelate epimerase